MLVNLGSFQKTPIITGRFPELYSCKVPFSAQLGAFLNFPVEMFSLAPSGRFPDFSRCKVPFSAQGAFLNSAVVKFHLMPNFSLLKLTSALNFAIVFTGDFVRQYVTLFFPSLLDLLSSIQDHFNY